MGILTIVRRLILVIVTILVVGSGTAQAEPEDDWDALYQQCIDDDHTDGASRAVADKLPDAVTDNVEKLYCHYSAEKPGETPSCPQGWN